MLGSTPARNSGIKTADPAEEASIERPGAFALQRRVEVHQPAVCRSGCSYATQREQKMSLSQSKLLANVKLAYRAYQT